MARPARRTTVEEVPMSKLVRYFGVNFKKGDYVFREGDTADVMYMIHKGRVQISKGFGSFDEKIRILGEGEFIGEMAVINQKPRSASAVAMDDCVLIKMDRESFNETIQKNHEFSVSVIQLLSERLRETDELIMKYANQERIGRLFSEILAEMLAGGQAGRRREVVAPEHGDRSRKMRTGISGGAGITSGPSSPSSSRATGS